MKRRAFIIEASEVPGEDDLAGARADAQAYHDWLYAKTGGDWYNSEIITLNTPRVAELRRAIEKEGKMDYAFVAFSGHGYHAKELDMTKLCLYDGVLEVYKLVPNADRCTVVVDACRKVMAEQIMESFQLSTAVVNKYAKFAERRNFRQEFENQVAVAEKGAIFMYSCDLDEAAGESRLGGYFSRFLVEGGRDFARNNDDGSHWLSTRSAFNRAAEATQVRNRQQNPQYEPGRRLKHFPFAV